MRDPSEALLIVDLQNDFCPGGALAVRGGDGIVEPLNRLLAQFHFVVATQDWHPPDHISFKARGGPWPPHCVQSTRGAELHPKLDQTGIHLKIQKGTSSGRDAYSGFQETTLDRELKKRNIRKVFVAGLATDYCVKQTALDALKRGYEVTVLTDLVAAVNVKTGGGDLALEEIHRAGGHLARSTGL